MAFPPSESVVVPKAELLTVGSGGERIAGLGASGDEDRPALVESGRTMGTTTRN